MEGFEKINKAYNKVFNANHLSIGIVVPIEHYPHGAHPSMKEHITRAKLAEEVGFTAIWTRDIPLNVPSFGDVGQMYDPFTYLGFMAAHTSDIALGISSIALPLHHPLHIAKSAATIDQLSEGRFILGVASGDRPNEYPSMGFDFDQRGELFRESFEYIRNAQDSFPVLETTHYGTLNGQVDVLPKAFGHKIPMLMTGFSRQSLEWNAAHADGWMYYPRNVGQQHYMIQQWRELISKSGAYDKPFMQPLYVILEDDDDFKPQAIQLGFRIGVHHLIDYFFMLRDIGVNHIAINLRFNTHAFEQTLEKLGTKLISQFSTGPKEHTPS